MFYINEERGGTGDRGCILLSCCGCVVQCSQQNVIRTIIPGIPQSICFAWRFLIPTARDSARCIIIKLGQVGTGLTLTTLCRLSFALLLVSSPNTFFFFFLCNQSDTTIIIITRYFSCHPTFFFF